MSRIVVFFAMIWAKRRLFRFAEFAPYQNHLGELTVEYPSDEFFMVSVGTDYFVGLPTEQFLPFFNGFEVVNEADLPKKVNVLVGDTSSEEFNRLFVIASTPKPTTPPRYLLED
jgi:hypothetical protein